MAEASSSSHLASAEDSGGVSFVKAPPISSLYFVPTTTNWHRCKGPLPNQRKRPRLDESGDGRSEAKRPSTISNHHEKDP